LSQFLPEPFLTLRIANTFHEQLDPNLGETSDNTREQVPKEHRYRSSEFCEFRPSALETTATRQIRIPWRGNPAFRFYGIRGRYYRKWNVAVMRASQHTR
jgi:hypothetical protein